MPSVPLRSIARLPVRLAALLLLLPACLGTGEPDARWAETQVEVPSYRILWEYALLALQKHGYPDSSGIDPNSLVAESGWDTNLQPFKGAGYRARAIVELSERGGDAWSVRVRVKRQFNQAIAKPLDASYAEWEWGDDDEVEAQLVLQTIRSYVDTAGGSGGGPAPAGGGIR